MVPVVLDDENPLESQFPDTLDISRTIKIEAEKEFDDDDDAKL